MAPFPRGSERTIGAGRSIIAADAVHEAEEEHMGKLAKRHEAERALTTWPGFFAPTLFKELEQLFEDRWRWRPGLLRGAELPDVPPVDVFEEGDAVVVKAEIPGLRKEEIEVQVEGDLVTISGKKEKEEKVAEEDYYRYERTAGAFSRAVALPVEVEPGKATAQLKDGVLELRMPKKAGVEPKAKKITIA